jgi:hypothetical protein
MGSNDVGYIISAGRGCDFSDMRHLSAAHREEKPILQRVRVHTDAGVFTIEAWGCRWQNFSTTISIPQEQVDKARMQLKAKV